MEEYQLTQTQLEQYINTLRRNERAAGTVEKYCRDLTCFASWLGSRAVESGTAAAWKEALLASGLAPVTVNSKLSALNSFFRFQGWNCRVTFVKIQRRVFREQSRDLSRTEYSRLLAAARSAGKERLALLLEAICATGIRVSEVRCLTVDAARRGQADVALKGKIRTLLLPAKLCRKLLKYAGQQQLTSGEIFRTKTGKAISRQQIWREMKLLCRQAGVAPSKVFPHNLRHLFATVFYRACQDIVKLADILGHSSINTTRIYLQTTGAEHARQLERLRLVT